MEALSQPSKDYGSHMRYLPFHWILSFPAILLFVASVATASVPLVKAGQTFTCTPTHVWDGDGPIWCEEGPRLRLAGIAAREMDGDVCAVIPEVIWQIQTAC